MAHSRAVSEQPDKLAEVGEELADVICYALALANELESQIATAIGALPPRQREVLILVSCEGFRLAEAAEILQISESKVSASLYVARQQMSKALSPYLNLMDKDK